MTGSSVTGHQGETAEVQGSVFWVNLLTLWHLYQINQMCQNRVEEEHRVLSGLPWVHTAEHVYLISLSLSCLVVMRGRCAGVCEFAVVVAWNETFCQVKLILFTFTSIYSVSECFLNKNVCFSMCIVANILMTNVMQPNSVLKITVTLILKWKTFYNSWYW